mmetsp:Transcript_109281/g.309141  ORF Transcript_109281/g.309141 Transcript_109281/m.309141 type:complete len:315 (-) Transcript_109281:121-1065(-)
MRLLRQGRHPPLELLGEVAGHDRGDVPRLPVLLLELRDPAVPLLPHGLGLRVLGLEREGLPAVRAPGTQPGVRPVLQQQPRAAEEVHELVPVDGLAVLGVDVVPDLLDAPHLLPPGFRRGLRAPRHARLTDVEAVDDAQDGLEVLALPQGHDELALRHAAAAPRVDLLEPFPQRLHVEAVLRRGLRRLLLLRGGLRQCDAAAVGRQLPAPPPRAELHVLRAHGELHREARRPAVGLPAAVLLDVVHAVALERVLDALDADHRRLGPPRGPDLQARLVHGRLNHRLVGGVLMPVPEPRRRQSWAVCLHVREPGAS